jgi:hypothetical protein
LLRRFPGTVFVSDAPLLRHKCVDSGVRIAADKIEKSGLDAVGTICQIHCCEPYQMLLNCKRCAGITFQMMS